MGKKSAQARPNTLLRLARKERGWTQKDVADRIGAPLPLNVTRWEGGSAFPSPHYVERLCLLFGKSASELGLIQDEVLTTPEPDEDATILIDRTPSPPIPPARRSFMRPIAILLAALALLLVITSTVLLYTTINRPRPTPTLAPTRTLPAFDITSTARTAATATLVATNPDPYPPRTGKLAFLDPLTSPYLWHNQPAGSSGDTCQFTGGVFHVGESQTGTTSLCLNSDFDGANFTIEAQMSIIQGDCGGIIFRSNEPKDYQFAVCQDGFYTFDLYQDLTNSRTLVSKKSPAINIGLNQPNVIALVANGSTFDLYVNQQKIDTVHDSAYSHGQLALIAFSTSTPLTDITYSHLRVWTLP
ncbi:MAG TPA: helix-turn-helix domain-containing protein [Ktedonosporobacter sp.]|nr:helix-turn-helix domain-containing protein [Ktedonosporobacter sp.]